MELFLSTFMLSKGKKAKSQVTPERPKETPEETAARVQSVRNKVNQALIDGGCVLVPVTTIRGVQIQQSVEIYSK